MLRMHSGDPTFGNFQMESTRDNVSLLPLQGCSLKETVAPNAQQAMNISPNLGRLV